MDGARRIPTLWLSIHCQSKIYTACSRIKADWSSTVFAHELTTRSDGFDAENRLYLFALTMPRQDAALRPDRPRGQAHDRSDGIRGQDDSSAARSRSQGRRIQAQRR